MGFVHDFVVLLIVLIDFFRIGPCFFDDFGTHLTKSYLFCTAWRPDFL